MITVTDLHYAGRPVVQDGTGALFYLISKHRSYKTAKNKVEKLDFTKGVHIIGPHTAGQGKMYWVVSRLPKDKEQAGRRKLRAGKR